jgi:hypothetical protein
MNDIRFWATMSELNTYLTIISIESPQYEERISRFKKDLTKYIEQNLELSKEVAKIEKKFWMSRNN